MLTAQSSTQSQHKTQGLFIEPWLLTWHGVPQGVSMPLLWLALSHCELVPKQARTGTDCSLSKVSATWWKLAS